MASEKIIEKLAKLIRHEQSARDIGNLEEAEAFASKVQELLTTHKLEMSDIEFEEREQGEPVDEETVRPSQIGIKHESKRVQWQEDLAWSIAHANGCRTLVSNRSNYAFFVGRTTDRQICVQLYSHFVKLAFDLAEKAATISKDEQREKCKRHWHIYHNAAQFAWWMRAFRKSFCVGFSYAIQNRLSDRRRELEQKKAAKDGEQCAALVHIKKDSAAIEAWIEDRFKDTKPSKAKDRIDESFNGLNGDGYRQGERAGKETALTAHVFAEGCQ